MEQMTQKWWFSISLWLLTTPFVAAQIYSASVCIENPRIEAGNLTFEITVQNTGIQPLYLAECDFVWKFNQQHFQPVGGLTLRVQPAERYAEYVLELKNPQHGILALAVSAPPLSDPQDLGNLIPSIPPDRTSIIGTVAIGPISDVTGKAELQWNTAEPFQTLLSTFREDQPDQIEFIQDDALEPCPIPDIRLEGGGGRGNEATRPTIKVSPNPITGRFKIETPKEMELTFTGPFTVYLYSLKGGEVHRWENQETNGLGEIHLNLPPTVATGTYLLELWKDNKLIGSIPIVVKR